MDPYALLSLLLLALFIATLVGMATKRLTHRYYLYFSLIFLGSSMLALANSSFAGNYASSASLLSVLLYLTAMLGLFSTKTKKTAEPVKRDAGFSSKKVRPSAGKKKETRSQKSTKK
jgi:predicted tellurium resistance membrane protein TerC